MQTVICPNCGTSSDGQDSIARDGQLAALSGQILSSAAEPVLLGLQVISPLQVDPGPLGRAEEMGQPQRAAGRQPRAAGGSSLRLST
jgi:hypothetical protein